MRTRGNNSNHTTVIIITRSLRSLALLRYAQSLALHSSVVSVVTHSAFAPWSHPSTTLPFRGEAPPHLRIRSDTESFAPTLPPLGVRHLRCLVCATFVCFRIRSNKPHELDRVFRIAVFPLRVIPHSLHNSFITPRQRSIPSKPPSVVSLAIQTITRNIRQATSCLAMLLIPHTHKNSVTCSSTFVPEHGSHSSWSGKALRVFK